jgi:heat shock protein HslJ
MKKSFFLLILGFFMLSCTAAREDTQTIKYLSLFDTQWNLVEINQKAIDTSNAQKKPYIQFSEKDMSAIGSNGCNSFSVSINTVEERLSFGPVMLSRMACQEWMENEMVFLAMLQAAQRYTIDGYALLIMDTKGRVLAKFIAES